MFFAVFPNLYHLKNSKNRKYSLKCCFFFFLKALFISKYSNIYSFKKNYFQNIYFLFYFFLPYLYKFTPICWKHTHIHTQKIHLICVTFHFLQPFLFKKNNINSFKKFIYHTKIMQFLFFLQFLKICICVSVKQKIPVT